MADCATHGPASLNTPRLTEEQQALLDSVLRTLGQGDVIRLPTFAIVGSPMSTTLSGTAERFVQGDEQFVTVDRPLKTGLFAVLTQTCDIRRGIGLEPFLVVAPLIVLPVDEWNACLHGRRGFRNFSYPYPIEGHQRLALDARVCQTVEKEALVAGQAHVVPAPTEAGFRAELQAWLRGRFGRHAFPDDLEQQVLRRLRERWNSRSAHTSDDGKLIRATDAIYVRYSQGSAAVDLIFMVRKARLGDFGDSAETVGQRLDGAIATLLKPIHAHLERANSGLVVTGEARTPDRIPASDLLYRYHLLDVG